MPLHKQEYLNEKMANTLTYDAKIDNFLEIKKFRSFAVSSLLDEEIINNAKVVGTL